MGRRASATCLMNVRLTLIAEKAVHNKILEAIPMSKGFGSHNRVWVASYVSKALNAAGAMACNVSVTSGVNLPQNQRVEFREVASADSPDPIEDAAVLGPIKAKPFGWPRKARPALTGPARDGCEI